MARRRKNTYFPLATSTALGWYVARDRFGALVETERLEPGSGLRAILREVMETRAQRGWEIEVDDEPRFGEFLCSKGHDQLCICIQPTDPYAPPRPGQRPRMKKRRRRLRIDVLIDAHVALAAGRRRKARRKPSSPRTPPR